MSVSCGDVRTFAVTEEGDLYVFGNNSRGILGTGWFVTDHQPIPYRISHETVFSGEEVGMIASSSFSNAVVTRHGLLFTWGSSWGLGHGRRVTESAPVYVDKATFEVSPIIMVACGVCSSIALTEGGGCGHVEKDSMRERMLTTICFTVYQHSIFMTRKSSW